MKENNKLAKTSSNKLDLRSKKGRQEALKLKIEEIDKELKAIGVGDLKYRVSNTITNPETVQNSINLSQVNDISFLVRLINHFEGVLKTKKELEKDGFKFPDSFSLNNINGINISNIIHDLKLRLAVLINSTRINFLTQAREKLLPFLDEESRFVNTLKEVTDMFNKLEK